MKPRVLASVALLGAFVLGLAIYHPTAWASEIMAVTKCALASTPCNGGNNSSSGSGTSGVSTNGNGVVGQTKFPSKTSSKYKAGVYGQDVSATGVWDTGVWGTSVRGTAVLGTSSNNIGVEGLSNKSTGVLGQVNTGGKSPTGVIGIDATSNTNGAGVAGQTNVGTGVIAATTGSSNSTQALLASAPNGNALVFLGVGSQNSVVAVIDNQGNEQLGGLIFTNGQCGNGCSRPNTRVRSYGAMASAPTLEDTGEAQLTGGAAYVRLDPAFANAIDPHQGYYVLITPEGETRGLYVSQRTAGGFAVRENFAGRSSAQFAYRIVAHPYGAHQPRLPFVQAQAAHAWQPMEAQPVRPDDTSSQ